MARRISKDFKLYRGTFIGPVMVINPKTRSHRPEAICHLCDWSNHSDSLSAATDSILYHLDSAHWNKDLFYEWKAENIPGHGAACN